MTDNWSNRLAECVGLWIAEGDDKTIREITFTNNCELLVKLFYQTLSKIFPKNKFRLYTYSPNGGQSLKLRNCRAQLYKDIRARKPYHILRYANTKDVIKWRKIVSKITSQEKYFVPVLKGFFAGEGNIKSGVHSNRTIRIAQKEKIELIDKILKYLDIKSTFSTRERAYVITGWSNWEKFYKYNLFVLHPDKRAKFLATWKSFKEIHYPSNYIRNNILQYLSKPVTSKELSIIFNRKQATLQDHLTALKREGKITNYRCLSRDYWIRSDLNMIIISQRKSEILQLLEIPCKTSEIAKLLDVNWKAAKKRLDEMQRLKLIQQKQYLWNKLPIDKEVIVI
ncbi:MAG: hypothetical protein HYU56_03725 [Candidatus Aenigmarchaeota archaeon]|nr:hypothetical protein [Candidatus Aenigmarchaeota archaeon]